MAELVAEFPAVLVTGPRATGKTTLALQHAVSVARLDRPDMAAVFRADPDAALRRYPGPLLIDEWQEVPEVLPAVKRAVDQDGSPGRFILTGSVRAPLQHETWAGTGRVVRLALTGLAEREVEPGFTPTRPGLLARLIADPLGQVRLPDARPDLDGYIGRAFLSGFPELRYPERTELSRGRWLAGYLDDVVTRDARSVGAPKDPDKLRRYLEVLALSTAGIPTEATLVRSAGINQRTATGYDELLVNLSLLELVPAWPVTGNRLNALVKAPKRYVVDPALATAAARLTQQDVLRSADLIGRVLDTFVQAQLRVELGLLDPTPRLHHIRTAGGRQEVDLVVDLGGRGVIGIEVKAGSAPTSADARHLRALRDDVGAGFVVGLVLHTGPEVFPLDDRVLAVPICALWG